MRDECRARAWLEEFWRAIHALWQAQSEAGRLPFAHGPTPARVAADRRVAEAMRRVETADDALHEMNGEVAAAQASDGGKVRDAH